MKIYVISLERAHERRSFMQRQMQQLGLEYELVDAIDYLRLTKEEFERLTDADSVSQNPALTKGMQACALSHAKVMEKIVSSGEKMSLVLEDDALLPPNIGEMLNILEETIQNDEIISLSYYHYEGKEIDLCQKGRMKLIDQFDLVYPVNINVLASAMAYIVPLDVAKKLGKTIVPVSALPDDWQAYYRKGVFSSFRCVYPVPAMPALFRSTLDYAAGKTIKSRIAAAIRRNRLPVLAGWLEKRSQKLINQKYVYRFLEQPAFMEDMPATNAE